MNKQSNKRRTEAKLRAENDDAKTSLFLHRQMLCALAKKRGGVLRVPMRELGDVAARLEVIGECVVYSVGSVKSSRRFRQRNIGLGVAVALAFCAVLLLARIVFADAPTYRGADVRPGDDVTLAIMCSGESGARDLPTCTAQLGVIARTAAQRDLSMGAHARNYSSVFNGSRPWLLELNAEGTRPEHWPRASWSRYRVEWLALLAHVRAELAADKAPPCPTARHFGSVRLDGHRMRDFARVCEGIGDRQGFWAVRR